MTEPPAMRVLINGGWHALTRPNGGDALSLEDAEFARRIEAAIMAERLMILLGSGASMGIADDEGNRLAPSMQDLWDTVAGVAGSEAAVKLADKETVERKDVERLLSLVQASLELKRNEGLSTFLRAAEDAIAAACRFVSSDIALPSHELLLRRVARRSTKVPRTQIYTTNYDLAVEEAASRTGFSLIDGFDQRAGGRFDGANFDIDYVRRRPGEALELEPNVAQLLKIHGSVGWDSATGVLKRSELPKKPALVYPARDKFRLSYEAPYLECLARFQMALRERDVALITVGFGFNDDHIAAPIESAIRSNVGFQLVVVTPSAEKTDNEHIAFARSLASAGDSRITLVSSRFDDFVSRLPDIAGTDERDLHLERLANARGTGSGA